MENLGNNLLRYNLADKKFIVFDFEVVEGLNQFYSRPHQLAWIIFHGNKKESFYNYYLKWKEPLVISDGAAKITRFNQAVIDQQGVPPEEALKKFALYINNPEYYIVGANILDYDVMIYRNSCRKLNIPCDYSFLNRCYDVNALFKIYKLNRKVDNKNLLANQLSANNYVRKGFKSNVDYMCEDLLKEKREEHLSHEALYDCEYEARIFFELIKKIDLE